jgi:hypothetical protein
MKRRVAATTSSAPRPGRGQGGSLNHLETRIEDGTTCCYAPQDTAWVTGRAGSPERSTPCWPTPAPSWRARPEPTTTVRRRNLAQPTRAADGKDSADAAERSVCRAS